MKYSIRKSIYILISFLLVSFSACKKHVAGPKGDQGVNGDKGNMKKTDRTFKVATSSWTAAGAGWITAVYAPEITNDVIAKGEVKVYMKIGEQWWSLPYGVGDIFTEQTSEVNYLYLKHTKIHDGPPAVPAETTFKLITFAPVN